MGGMTTPLPWCRIERHAMLPAPGHDMRTRLDVVAHLNRFLATNVLPAVSRDWEQEACPAFKAANGREPASLKEARDLMENRSSHLGWGLLRRTVMEYRQQVGRQLALSEAVALRDRAQRLNRGRETLKLNPALPIPRHVSAVDTHLMPGGYAAEYQSDDVTNPASYDAGLFATIGGGAGPLNDAAGRALVGWMRGAVPEFRPHMVVDLACGLGHNTLPLRQAFPEARIVALDVAAPFLRYGHARAVSLGVEDVEFWQEDATATSLPDGCADLVFTTMVLHETSAKVLPAILRECHRLLMPGGITIHLEQPPYRQFAPLQQFLRDWDGRHNNEPYWTALHQTNLPQLLEEAGFEPGSTFETTCRAGSITLGQPEDPGRAPVWYAVGARK